MKGHRGASDAKAAIILALFVVLAALALAACGGSPKSGSTASMTTPSTTASPAKTPAAASNPSQAARTGSVVKALMTTWNTAWSASRDRRGLLSLYADDVQYYDDAAIDTVITKSDMDAMNQDPAWWKSFQLTLKSSFVSVLAVANDKIVWECDYYGGEPGKAGQTTPMLAVPSGAVAPGSTTAQTAIAEATAGIGKWLSAFNGRNATSFLTYYADKARYVDVVSPRWRVMTKSQLAADVASQFARTEFQSRLEPSPGSAMGSSFFVSADGRFAAVQGTYADEIAGGRLVDQPMLAILELRAGQIVRQYNFVAMDRSLLRP